VKPECERQWRNRGKKELNVCVVVISTPPDLPCLQVVVQDTEPPTVLCPSPVVYTVERPITTYTTSLVLAVSFSVC
jgi:hypothetical protein